MKMNNVKKTLSLIVCIVLIAALALFTIGCSGKKTESDMPVLEGGKIGEGSTSFAFTVVDPEGKETKFEVYTDKETVGEALQDAGIIAGESGSYGMYVKTVNGTTVDFEKDGLYWAFYIDGQYAMTSVDQTDIEAGAEYSMRAEK